jgi:hypothetical protein
MKPTVKVEGITLHRNGKPLTASDIPEGAEITFDRTTGEVTAVRQRVGARGARVEPGSVRWPPALRPE